MPAAFAAATSATAVIAQSTVTSRSVPRAASRSTVVRGEAVAVVDAAGQVPVDVGAERAQGAHEDRGRADPVHVVVAVHGDARAPRDVAEDHPGAVAQAAEGVERMRVLGGEEPLRRHRVAQPAAHEHLREHVRDPQLAAELLGGGEVVGGDVEAGILAAHGREAMAAGGRKRARRRQIGP